ncbi:ABC transporter substrate-binding protein, partial [Corynebacterium bovis]|uniref:ABC transporter substrate-binding protein n=1 Tax=Corynebacterium bovis TaxID=36808 RepID=UPI003139EB1B
PHDRKAPVDPISRRDVLRWSALTAAGAVALPAVSALTACAGPGPGGGTPGDPVTVGYVPIACAAPLVLADARGLFARHGVSVTLRRFAGWADLWSAYATGDIDVAHMLTPMPVVISSGAVTGRRPTRIIATQNTNGQALTLAARHVGHVTSAADLRGTVLAIPFEYSVHALLLRDHLAAAGVDPTRDVELRLLRPADMVAQLEVGGIDGFIGPEPFNQRALASGAGRIFTLTRALWDRHPCCCVAVAADWDDAHPDVTAGLVAGLRDAATLANSPGDRAEVASALAADRYLNQKPALLTPVLAGTYTDWHGAPVTDPDRIRFGDPTDPAAVTWMTAQLGRWGVGGGAFTGDDAIRAAVRAVLPRDRSTVLPDTPGRTLTVNGRVFDPDHPTDSLREDTR